jgi:hypothetical protein
MVVVPGMVLMPGIIVVPGIVVGDCAGMPGGRGVRAGAI